MIIRQLHSALEQHGTTQSGSSVSSSSQLGFPSSQIQDPFILRQLHAWTDSSLTSVQCNIAEALDLPNRILCAREHRPLFLHLGIRPTKWVTVVGRVVGCEEREGFTRVYVDDGTAVLTVRHHHLVIPTPIIATAFESDDNEASPEEPPCGIPPEYLPPAPPAPPVGRTRAGAPDAAERARTGAAAARRARVEVGCVVKVCGRIAVQAWGITCVVGKDKWGNGGGFVEPQTDPNVEAQYIIATVKARKEYLKPFIPPSFVGGTKHVPAARMNAVPATVAGPYSRPALRTMSDAITAEMHAQREANREKRRDQFLNGGASSKRSMTSAADAAATTLAQGKMLPPPIPSRTRASPTKDLEREKRREAFFNGSSSKSLRSMAKLPANEQDKIDESAVASTAALDAELERERKREQFLRGASSSRHHKIKLAQELPLRAESVEVHPDEAVKSLLQREKLREKFLHGATSTGLWRAQKQAQRVARGHIIDMEPEVAMVQAPGQKRPRQDAAPEEEVRRRQRRSRLGFVEPPVEELEAVSAVAVEVPLAVRHVEPASLLKAPQARRREFVSPALNPDTVEKKRILARAMGVAFHEEDEGSQPTTASSSRFSHAANVAPRVSSRTAATVPFLAPQPTEVQASNSRSTMPARATTPIMISSSPPLSPAHSPMQAPHLASRSSSTSPTRKLRSHATLPDSKITEGLFNLHLRVYLAAHHSAASDSSDEATTFTASSLQRSRGLRTLAERLVRVNLARARRTESTEVVREKVHRLFLWTLGLLAKEGVVQRTRRRNVVLIEEEEAQKAERVEGKKRSLERTTLAVRKRPRKLEVEEEVFCLTSV